MKIKKGDTVEVISGNNKGTRGTVHRVIPGQAEENPKHHGASLDQILVSGVNMVKKHQRRTGDVRTQVGIIEREAPVHLSNVALVCPHCDRAVRVGYEIQADGTKVRICKRCHEAIE